MLLCRIMKTKKMNIVNCVLEVLKGVFIDNWYLILPSVILLLGTIFGVFGFARSVGDSCYPYHKDGDLTFIISSKIVEPKRFDFIGIKVEGIKEEYSGKRVVGMPGDTIEIVGGNVYINGELLDEPHAYYDSPAAKKRINQKEITLTDTQYYVLGDNRNHSYDSTEYGPVEKENVYWTEIFKIGW